jgi:hypothetical protein
MSCPWRRNTGSGYTKPCDPELAKSNMTALERLRAERAAQDARMAAMWADKPKDPVPPSETKKKETPAPAPPKQRYIMKGD